MTSELKPCPFCGSTAEITEYHTDNFEVTCSSEGCGVRPNTILGGKEIVIEDWNTRAVPDVPDVPELVTLGAIDMATGELIRLRDMDVNNILHIALITKESADKIIAAKDGVQKSWQNIAKHHTGYENPSGAFRVLLERAEAAEAKLAQYEAQEPVAWLVDDGVMCSRPSGWEAKYAKPLYAAPVPAADLKAENEKLRKALKNLIKPHDEPCRHDHHGYCQTHFVEAADECCVKVAKDLIGENGT